MSGKLRGKNPTPSRTLPPITASLLATVPLTQAGYVDNTPPLNSQVQYRLAARVGPALSPPSPPVTVTLRARRIFALQNGRLQLTTTSYSQQRSLARRAWTTSTAVTSTLGTTVVVLPPSPAPSPNPDAALNPSLSYLVQGTEPGSYTLYARPWQPVWYWTDCC